MPRLNITKYAGTDFPSKIDESDERRSITDSNSGYLTYGPYISLSEGQYKVRVYYSTDTNNNWIDIYSSGGGEVYRGVLSARDSVHEIDFSLNKITRNIEIRSYYSGEGTLSIDNVIIQGYGKELQATGFVLNAIIVAVFTGYIGYLIGGASDDFQNKWRKVYRLLIVLGFVYFLMAFIFIMSTLKTESPYVGQWVPLITGVIVGGISILVIIIGLLVLED